MAKRKKSPTLYERVTEAREILTIPEEATLAEIKERFKKEILYWHPDKCPESEEKCREESDKIIRAYKVLKSYCEDYKYPFTLIDIERNAPYEEVWTRMYGNDPMWGPPI